MSADAADDADDNLCVICLEPVADAADAPRSPVRTSTTERASEDGSSAPRDVRSVALPPASSRPLATPAVAAV